MKRHNKEMYAAYLAVKFSFYLKSSKEILYFLEKMLSRMHIKTYSQGDHQVL